VQQAQEVGGASWRGDGEGTSWLGSRREASVEGFGEGSSLGARGLVAGLGLRHQLWGPMRKVRPGFSPCREGAAEGVSPGGHELARCTTRFEAGGAFDLG